MRGAGEKPKAPPIKNYNPLNIDSKGKEKATEGSQQSEPENLVSIVSKKNRADSIREKIKSLKPRSPRTMQDPEVVTLIPPHRENPTERLTKINLSGSEITGFLKTEFSQITPRPSMRPQHDFLGSRAKNIAIEPIDEGGESNANASKAEPSEKPHVQSTAWPQYSTAESIERVRNKPDSRFSEMRPFGIARTKTASANREKLGEVVAPREKQESSAPGNPWKAPSDDADFQEREQEHIDLMRPVMEKTTLEESLDTTHSKEEGIEEVEGHRTFTDDEYAALLMARKKTSRIEQSRTPAKLKSTEKRSVLPSVRSKAIKITQAVGLMIRDLDDAGFASKRMRALNILYYLCSGESVIDKKLHPEIRSLAKYLEPLSFNEKFACLQLLYMEVEEHLDYVQKLGMESAFEEIKISQRRFGTFTLRKIALNLEYQLVVQAADEAEAQADH